MKKIFLVILIIGFSTCVFAEQAVTINNDNLRFILNEKAISWTLPTSNQGNGKIDNMNSIRIKNDSDLDIFVQYTIFKDTAAQNHEGIILFPSYDTDGILVKAGRTTHKLIVFRKSDVTFMAINLSTDKTSSLWVKGNLNISMTR